MGTTHNGCNLVGRGDGVLRKPHQQFTSLLVDGDLVSRGTLDKFLNKEGHTVLTAGDGEEAIIKTRRFQPDLILLDCDFPGVPCLPLLPLLLEANSNASVILLAIKPKTKDVVEGMRLGAADYFERPVDLVKLKEAIRVQRALFRSGEDV